MRFPSAFPHPSTHTAQDVSARASLGRAGVVTVMLAVLCARLRIGRHVAPIPRTSLHGRLAADQIPLPPPEPPRPAPFALRHIVAMTPRPEETKKRSVGM